MKIYRLNRDKNVPNTIIRTVLFYTCPRFFFIVKVQNRIVPKKLQKSKDPIEKYYHRTILLKSFRNVYYKSPEVVNTLYMTLYTQCRPRPLDPQNIRRRRVPTVRSVLQKYSAFVRISTVDDASPVDNGNAQMLVKTTRVSPLKAGGESTRQSVEYGSNNDLIRKRSFIAQVSTIKKKKSAP